MVVSTSPQDPAVGSFPQPSELLGPATIPTPLPPAQPTRPKRSDTVAAPAWPGMNLEWPKMMPFGQSPNTPPPGPGGGRIDPFKRARPQP
jgi:hypothetical protein